MKYIVDIPKWLDIKIKKILAEEALGYSSVEEFIIVACENQIKIESAESGETFETGTQVEARTVQEKKFEHLLTSDIPSIHTVSIPMPEKVETILLWGQVYRIFPIKLGARILANIIKEIGTEYIDLEDFREKAANAAREFGIQLEMLDEQNRRKVGEKFSTGLPIGDKVELSKNRYKAQYLAYQTGKGTIVGALADLRLANIEGDKIGITEKGLEFAKLENPLLDSKDANPAAVLLEGEINCYLSLISEFLPEETAFMKTVLGMIESEEPPRGEFNSKVKEFLERTWKREITYAVANTMRSGALSRMWELKLVESKRVGKTVVYSITEDGRNYLNEATGGD